MKIGKLIASAVAAATLSAKDKYTISTGMDEMVRMICSVLKLFYFSADLLICTEELSDFSPGFADKHFPLSNMDSAQPFDQHLVSCCQTYLFQPNTNSAVVALLGVNVTAGCVHF